MHTHRGTSCVLTYYSLPYFLETTNLELSWQAASASHPPDSAPRDTWVTVVHTGSHLTSNMDAVDLNSDP